METMRTVPGRTRRPDIDALEARPPAWTAGLAWAGIIGPVLFTAAFIGQEALRRSEYNPLAETVSALEAGPNGWVQQVNFVIFGLLTMAFAVGLQLGLRRTRLGLLGPALLFTSGIGLLLAAGLPLREDAAGVTYDPGGHFVAGLTFFLTSALGLIALSRRLARDPNWRGLAGYTLAAGVVSLLGFFVMGALVMPDAAPLHDWAGLAQRVLILLVLFPCRVVLSLRSRRLVSGSAPAEAA
jgi:hypothetical membrane protein